MRGRRPKARKFDHAELATVVRSRLRVKWSPEQISLHLAERFPERAEMRVCPETESSRAKPDPVLGTSTPTAPGMRLSPALMAQMQRDARSGSSS